MSSPAPLESRDDVSLVQDELPRFRAVLARTVRLRNATLPW
jgi:hypothetical protein